MSVAVIFCPGVYQHVVEIARRIETCSARFPGHVICILKGDVEGTFRHFMLASPHVRWICAQVSQSRALIIYMSVPFGWTGSPTFYGVSGNAILWLVGRESPATSLGEAVSADREPFFPYEWVDDHILVEPDTTRRLKAAESCLRLAMMAVLGHRVINEAKFSAWSTNIEVIGLQFSTISRTMTMPRENLGKAAARVARLQRASTTSRHELQCLLGSLRHVTCILRSAKPFFQRIQSAVKRAQSRGRFPMTDAVRADLQWFHYILEHGVWSDLPTSMFSQEPPIDVHWYMDASDSGLAVADPAQQHFIQLAFDDNERSMIHSAESNLSFNINVRDLFCVALAAVLWGPDCPKHFASKMIHVMAWSANTSAVTWTNRLHSDNLFAQELLRTIGLCEATQLFRISAGHLPGKCNVLADAGSQQHSDRLARYGLTQLVIGHRQRFLPHSARCIDPSRQTSIPSTGRLELSHIHDYLVTNGTADADLKVALPGSPATAFATQLSSSDLRYSAGSHDLLPEKIRPAPFCPRLTISAGFIGSSVASPSDSTKATNWPCAGCRGCHHHRAGKSHSPSSRSNACAPSATSTPPMTALSGGLRSWASAL